MKKGHLLKIACGLLLFSLSVKAQSARSWNNKECAVVLTYDDAINADLDNIAPALDSLNLKATFYLIGSSPVIAARLDAWRKVAKNGHELGNHTMFHPCDGNRPGRSFVTADNDLSRYTLQRAVNEARAMNVMLTAIDGKTKRTLAYPCGDLNVEGQPLFKPLKNDFVAARGVTAGLETLGNVDMSNIKCFSINGQTAAQMIALVDEAMREHKLLIFLFHGVGGGHNINVGLNEHSKLLHYLAANQKRIWIAPMVDVAEYIKAHQ